VAKWEGEYLGEGETEVVAESTAGVTAAHNAMASSKA